MGPIDTALRDALFYIDPIILKAAFKDDLVNFNGYSRNIRDAITEIIIYDQIIPDLSIVAGEEIWIDLKEDYVKWRDERQVVFTVPPSAIGGREIITPRQISFKDYVIGQLPAHTTEGGLARIMNSTPDITGKTTTDVKMLGTTNTIFVTNFDTTTLNNHRLEAVVSHDRNLSAIPPKWYKTFSRLVELKLKAFLYVRMSTILDICESNAGVSIGNVKNILDRYSDAAEMYKEELERWIKYSQMYDENANADWIHMTTSFL